MMKKQQGFSLLELLVVIVILGILAALVAPQVLQNVGKAQTQKIISDFKAIETALKVYKLDNFVYPTTEQGLEALVTKSDLEPVPRNFQKGGYLNEVPMDPWNRPYLYVYPGQNGEIDIFTLGADGEEGGEDDNADIGNWSEQDEE